MVILHFRVLGGGPSPSSGSQHNVVLMKINGDPRVVSTLQWRSDARDDAVAKIVGTLEKAGITFLPERGGSVGLRGRIES